MSAAEGKVSMRSFSLLSLVLALQGCCFGDFAQGVSQGVALQTECAVVIDTANAATSRMETMPDPLAGVAEPTPEQVGASMEPMAQAYDQAAVQLSAITVTNAQLLAQRDALAGLYREAATTMRTQGPVLAEAMRTGDQATLDRAVAAGDALGPREDAIIAELNRVCARQ